MSPEASKLLTIVTNAGRFSYKVLPQGVCNSSALWNILTDGNSRIDSELQILKNMDDFMIYARSLEELEKKLEKFMAFAQEKNLKLNPKKFFISEEVEFGGSVVSSEKCANEDLVFISPKNKRVKAFEELKKPASKKDCQIFCGMLASFQAWNPSLPLEIPLLCKATASTGRFIWTEALEEEYNNVREIMINQIRLSPYDPSKPLRLVIDGASSLGVGFVLFQWLDEEDESKGAAIINANASMLKDNQLSYSPIEAECIGLEFAATCCAYWLDSNPAVELYSDCSGMLDMMKKPLCDLNNKRLQKIMMKIMSYNFNPHHIRAAENRLADALSRLCGLVSKINHTPCDNIRLLGMSKKASIYKKQVEVEDPLVLQLGIQAGLDLEYVEMVSCIENRVEYKNLPEDTELRALGDSLPRLGIVELRDGHRLIVRDGSEVLIPKSAREEIIKTLHISHPATETMINQTRGKIF